MTRGIRGATTVVKNTEKDILTETKRLLKEMIDKNNVTPEVVSHVFISATEDIDASFPAKAMRQMTGWSGVPVMCMKEMDVQHALKQCIRIMMVINTDRTQDQIKHIYQNKAVSLRPDLFKTE